MGLDAYVKDSGVDVRLGSYGWYHSFRLTVCDELEDRVWGSRFPMLQNHSDCDGQYSPAEAKILLEELKEIEEGLAEIQYPAVIYQDKDGNPLGENYKYSDRGIFCSGKIFAFGVDEDGIVVECYEHKVPDKSFFDHKISGKEFFNKKRKDYLGETIYTAHFDRMELVNEDTWRCYAGDKSIVLEGLYVCAPQGCVRIVYGTTSALKVFGPIIERLKALCKASIKTGNPIIFC